MKIEAIKDIALILRGDFPKGLRFYTEDKGFIQVGSWNYDKGKKTIPHAHKLAKRTANKTQEVVFIKHGKARVVFFNDKGEKIKTKTLNTGDIVIIFKGGHSFEILEDNTNVLEVKNGPYPGLEKDKKLI